jgi:hypothetical protein
MPIKKPAESQFFLLLLFRSSDGVDDLFFAIKKSSFSSFADKTNKPFFSGSGSGVGSGFGSGFRSIPLSLKWT